MDQTEINQAPNTLLKAVSMLCRPLLRLLIAKGVTYPQLRELLKASYVEVAEQEVTKNGKPPSDSQLFILTGIHRKDIKRLRQAGDDEVAAADHTATLSGAIVARWTGLAAYQDEAGNARKLPRNGDDKQPGFDQLVASVSKDVRPRAILDEWLRLGMVEVDEDGNVCLREQAFVPSRDFDEQAFYLARNVHDHLAACASNMQQLGQPMLERSVYYAALSKDSVNQLREVAQREAMDLLQRLNKQALKLQEQDEGLASASERMRFGCYWYDENLQQDEVAQ
jgi:hypothetical protein